MLTLERLPMLGGSDPFPPSDSSSSPRSRPPHPHHLQHYKFSQLNLSIPQTPDLNKLSSSHHKPNSSTPLKHSRPISLLNYDLLSFLFLFLQLHGLLFFLSYSFLPPLWRSYWSFSLLFLFDFSNFAIENGYSARRLGQVIFMLVWPFIVAGSYAGIGWYYSRLEERRARGEKERERKSRSALYRWIHSHLPLKLRVDQFYCFLCELSYLPLLLLLFRVYTCDSSSSLFFIDSSIICYSTSHYILLAITTFIVSICCIYLPFRLYRHLSTLILYHDSSLHERYIQSRELEYLLEINHLYAQQYLFLISSYTRPYAYTRIYMCLYKTLLVLILFLFGSYFGFNWPLPQAALFVAVLNVLVLYKLVRTIMGAIGLGGGSGGNAGVDSGSGSEGEGRENGSGVGSGGRQYRAISSDRLVLILEWTLLFTSIFSILLASNWQSSFTSYTVLPSILLSINIIGLGLWALLALWFKLYEREAWPIQDDDVRLVVLAEEELIELINTSKRLIQMKRGIGQTTNVRIEGEEEGGEGGEGGSAYETETFPRQQLISTLDKMRSSLHRLKSRREASSSSSHLPTTRFRLYSPSAVVAGIQRGAGGAKNESEVNSVSSERSPTTVNVQSYSDTMNQLVNGGMEGEEENRKLEYQYKLIEKEEKRLGEWKAGLLEWSVADFIEELALLYNTHIHPRSLNGNGEQGNSSAGGVQSERLSAALEGLGGVMSRKSSERVLMKKEKVDFVNKMMVLRGLLGDQFVYAKQRMEWNTEKTSQEQKSS